MWMPSNACKGNYQPNQAIAPSCCQQMQARHQQAMMQRCRHAKVQPPILLRPTLCSLTQINAVLPKHLTAACSACYKIVACSGIFTFSLKWCSTQTVLQVYSCLACAAYLDHEEVLVNNSIVGEAAHGGDVLLSHIKFSATLVALLILLAHPVHLLVHLCSVVESHLTRASHCPGHTGWMPCSNTGNLPINSTCSVWLLHRLCCTLHCRPCR